MKGYKAFEKGMVCRGKQYAENTVFEEPTADICSKGMHFCEDPFDVLDYYPLVDNKGKFSEFAEVEPLDDVKTDDQKKFCTTKLKIGAKLSFPGFVKACVDFMIEKTSASVDKRSSGDYAKIGSSGDNAKIGSSGEYAKIGISGNYAKIGSSGYYAKIGSSGDYAKIGSSGCNAKIGSSGCNAKIGSSGCDAKIGSSGCDAKIGSSGYTAKIGSSGDNAKIGSSGYNAKIGSSGDYAQIGSSGYYAKIGSSGDNAKIGSSGYNAKIGSSGDNAKIGSSGDNAKIGSSGRHSVVCCAGANAIAKARVGSWITLSEWKRDTGENACIPICVKTEYVDGERIKEDTWYKLVDGEFTEVTV